MEMFVIRLEYDNKGIFYDREISECIKAEARKITPEWEKNLDQFESTFLEYYCYNALGPYNNPCFDNRLSLAKEGTYLFGFPSEKAIVQLLGLDNEIYRKQFSTLIQQQIIIARWLLVDAVAYDEEQVLFRRNAVEYIEDFSFN